MMGNEGRVASVEEKPAHAMLDRAGRERMVHILSQRCTEPTELALIRQADSSFRLT
jgi:hypothetical protein